MRSYYWLSGDDGGSADHDDVYEYDHDDDVSTEDDYYYYDVSAEDDNYYDDHDDYDYDHDDATAATALATALSGEPWRSVAPANIRNLAGGAGSFLARIVNCLGRHSGNRAFEEAT